MQNHLSMMMQFKTQTISFLKNLYETANSATSTSKFSNNNHIKSSRTMFKVSKNKRNRMLRSKTITHSSDISYPNTKDYRQFKYKRYYEIVESLNKLSKEYPDYLRVDTAQNLYGLPNPGGYCGPNNQK